MEIGTQSSVTISGIIVDKNECRERQSWRQTKYYLNVDDPRLHRVVHLTVPASTFNRYAVGDPFQQQAASGSLGFIYFE